MGGGKNKNKHNSSVAKRTSVFIFEKNWKEMIKKKQLNKYTTKILTTKLQKKKEEKETQYNTDKT